LRANERITPPPSADFVLRWSPSPEGEDQSTGSR
jgi:hypothetical protein